LAETGRNSIGKYKIGNRTGRIWENIFVIRHSFEKEFREKIAFKYENSIPIEIVFQELDALPEDFALNPDREKPWDTNHAIIIGKII
jgi:hypothetical protein